MTLFSQENGLVSHRIGCLSTRIRWNSMEIPSKSGNFCIDNFSGYFENGIDHIEQNYLFWSSNQQKRITNWQPGQCHMIVAHDWRRLIVNVDALTMFLLVCISSLLATYEINVFVVLFAYLTYSKQMQLMRQNFIGSSSDKFLSRRLHRRCERVAFRYSLACLDTWLDRHSK